MKKNKKMQKTDIGDLVLRTIAMPKDTNFNLALPETRVQLKRMPAEERLEWAQKKFGENFVK